MKLKDVVLWLVIGFVVIGVLLHAAGFALVAGTLFNGTNQLGKTLEGRSSPSLGYSRTR